MRGRTWGFLDGWTVKMGKQHGSLPVTGSAIEVVDNLYYSCSSTALVEVSRVCAITGYTSVSAVQVRGSLSLHQGSVNWHGYTPSCSDPGAIWVAIKAQLALESLLATAL